MLSRLLRVSPPTPLAQRLAVASLPRLLHSQPSRGAAEPSPSAAAAAGSSKEHPIEVGHGSADAAEKGHKRGRARGNSHAVASRSPANEAPLMTRPDFDAFRHSINRIFDEFERSVGGGMGGWLGAGPSRSMWPSPLFSSMWESPLLGGGSSMLESPQSHPSQQQQQHRSLAPSMQESMDSSLSPLSDLMLSAPPASIPLDVEELPDKYSVSASVPGLKPRDLKVHAEGGVLTIEGRHREERREEDKNKRFLRVERTSGLVRRALSLPDDVDASKISAKYDAGVLRVTLPKRAHEAEQASGNVKIEAADEGAAAASSTSQQSGQTASTSDATPSSSEAK